jgi:hypothetical protein
MFKPVLFAAYTVTKAAKTNDMSREQSILFSGIVKISQRRKCIGFEALRAVTVKGRLLFRF